jgi:hypothetical protein|tara:strand:- start:1325 stop:1738 length:414 start_codon:yes stop_codon:yes gene_type:complete
MKDLIRFIKNSVSFNKKKAVPEPEPELSEEEIVTSGKMEITWEGTSGDFIVDFKLSDTTGESAETLALLLFYLEKGDLNSFILKSLEYRSKELEESEEDDFYSRVLIGWSLMNTGEKLNKLESVVSPSEVFNFRREQ